MKVIHLISGGDTGGAKTHIHYLLAGLCKSIDATLVCFSRGDFSNEAEELGIPTVIMDEGGTASTVRRLKKMIKDGGYDIIHSHGAKGNFMASLVKRSCGIPVVTTVHSDPELDYLGRPMAALVYGNINVWAMHRSDYLVGVSDSMRDLLISRGFEPNRVFSIYNGVDFAVKPENPYRKAYFEKFGMTVCEGDVIVGIAARLDPVKDVATLIRGFAEAAEKCPQLKLAIAGDGQEREKLEALAKELGVSERACFIGWTNEVNSFYAAIDINALTSISETFPYAVTEGARAGLATVSSRVGGVPMLVRDGETGFLFEPGDARCLGEKLALLASDPELRERLGSALYEHARRDFSVEATTRRQLDIYAEVLRREKLAKSGGRDGIVICGAYGMENSGDDAILEAIVGQMRSKYPFMPMTALSRSPKQTCEKYGIDCVHTFDIPGFRRVMKKTKLYISGGGSLIQNVTSRRSLFYYLYTIKTAKKLGNRVMMYGCGIGPVEGDADVKKAAKVMDECVDVIALREKYSYDMLRDFGVAKPKMLVSSDPALTLSPASADLVDAEMRKNSLDPAGKYVCFSIRRWTDFDQKAGVFAAAADYVRDELGCEPVFMLINPREDAAATEQVVSLMKKPAAVFGGSGDTALTIGVLGRMRAMVSMRLHGLIFAASQAVPLVGVSYDPKVTAFLASVGEKLCISYDSVSEKRLVSMIEEALSQYDDGEARRKVMAELIESEKQNLALASELLEH